MNDSEGTSNLCPCGNSVQDGSEFCEYHTKRVEERQSLLLAILRNEAQARLQAKRRPTPGR